MSNPDQRIYERHNVEIAIWVRLIGDCQDFNLAETVNISAGGVLLQVDSPIEPGSWMDLRLELPQDSSLISSTALVKHVMKTGENRFLAGVQFIDVKNYSIPVLMAYLEALYKK